MTARVLVAGIGNIFLGDDGFGVEVANRLSQRPKHEGVTVVDFGIRSYDLAYTLMDAWDRVILIDALPRGGEPGTLYLFEPEMPDANEAPSADAHTMDPVSVLQLVHALGGTVDKLLVVGCEPGTLDPDPAGEFALSAPVAAAVDEAIRMVEELVASVRTEANAA